MAKPASADPSGRSVRVDATGNFAEDISARFFPIGAHNREPNQQVGSDHVFNGAIAPKRARHRVPTALVLSTGVVSKLSAARRITLSFGHYDDALRQEFFPCRSRHRLRVGNDAVAD